MCKKMKTGQIVTVFQKPITKEQSEGKAKLLRRMVAKEAEDNRDSEVVENWEVKFLSDEFICERLINIKA